jgi:hypothetical protein
MGIFDIFSGNGQPTATTTQLQNTSQAQQLGNAVWTTTAIGNPHMQQINNPSTWNTVSVVDVMGEQIKELRYILQRTVENYDELQAQYKALQDIAKAGEST